MASSSSSASDSQYCPRWKYDVFLSFRGEDTRKTFTGHLYEGLKNRGIYTFQDNKRLEEGDSISEELLKAIEESQVAIVIFSKNYATSSWCLNELVKIVECKEKNGQIVIPVFYDVDPSEVRKQTKSFAEAFAQHESRYKDDAEGMQKVQRWRTALTTAADLQGYDIRNEIESEKIQQIIDHISSKFCKGARSLSLILQDVVGINAHLQKLNALLQIEINDVRVLGIWGIGGVGKTTIAKALFDTLSYQFKGACFLADVKENARKNELHSLQNTLLSELLRKKDDYVNNKHDGKSIIPNRLSSMKVLIVLDDIDHGDHLEYLAGNVGWFGNGSRVIVTTRNRHLINKDDAIYEVPTLPDHEAMQLFNKHAFKKEVPGECLKKLSLEVIDHAKGLPLALKVWGSLLHKKDLIQWRRTVDQIKKNSNLEIVEKLKISYDGLEPKEQKIFLDIACFFRGDKRTKVMQILESCGFEAEYGLDVLIDKSLVFIYEDEWIEMHDLIEDMGKYIVKMQKDSGKPSRIWNVEDFKDVMEDNTGSMAVEAIRFSYSEKLCFSVEAMTNMQRLRILCIEVIHRGFRIEDVALGIYRTFYEKYDSIEYLSNNLRWFVWHEYPWKLLPQNFNPRRLVHLDLRRSALHYLWNETKQLLSLLSLQTLDLSYCNKLKELPGFTGMPNLETLDLRYCNLTDGGLPEDIGSLSSLKKLYLSENNFEHLPRSIAQLGALRSLDLSRCYKLKELPGFMGMPNLETLDLSYCNLTDGGLPEDIGSLSSLKKLDLWRNNFEHLPRSIAQLGALQSLDLSNCNKLKEFPNFMGMPHLETLNLRNCNLTDGGLPEDIGSLSSLKKLYLSENNFEHLPRSIAQLGALQSLDLSYCNKLKEFPNFTGMPNLETLNLRHCNLTDGRLPEDIVSLSSLKKLDLRGNNFEHLPRSIAQLGALQSLDLSNCNQLKEFPDFTGMPNLETLDLSDCNLTDGGLPEDIGSLSSLKKLYLRGNNLEHLPRSIAHLGALQSLDLSNCNKLKEFPGFTGMPNLETLNLSYCNLTDGGLPEDIGSLSSLKKLYLSENNFEHLPRSIAQLGALRSLDLSCCYKLKELPGFTGMPNLETLDLSYCNLTDGGLPEDIGSLSSLKKLDLWGNNFEHLPRSIAQLGALQSLDLSYCNKLKEFPDFTRMPNLETLNLRNCNLTDGGLPEDIRSLSSLKKLDLWGNNFEHLPRSIAQLGALQSLDLSYCNKLKEFPDFMGMPNLETLNLRNCNLTDGGLPEDIASLSSLKKLDLWGNNFEHLPRSIAQLGALQSLDLSNCNKLKEFPNFTGMPNLETLNLRNCNLTDGGLPEDIGYLSSLKKLDLWGNNFEHLPRSIAQLGALQSLDLSYCNKLKEFPDFTGMPNLETLNLRNCNLTDGGLPEDIVSLSSLKKLDLRGNNFEHLPQSIAQLGALQSLDLSNCNKLKEFPDFTGMPKLETLDLSDCNLTDGGLPEDIGSLSSLKKLFLRGNNFEHLPRSIAQLGALQSLDLSNCNKLKELPGFKGMPNLETLDLSYCNLTDGGLPEDIGSVSSLKKLDLRGNNFEHLPRSIAQLGALQSLDLSNCNKLKEFPDFTGMPNLENLNLRNCNLTDGGLPEDIGSLSSLKKLDLRGNNFEHLPQSIAQLGALQSLDLSNCNKLKEFPDFTGMPNLETLNLRNCNLTDGGLPEDIVSLSSLKKLDLRGNNFEHLPRSIAQLGALQSLDLSNCNQLKEFPDFTGMPNLEILDLSDCNLTDGGLPEDIGSLSSLKKLDLRGNNFEHLPRSIAQLGALQSLDLSNCNKLKEFPGFTGMPNLETLNLSYCNLTDGGLPEDIGSLSSLKKLDLRGNNFEHLPRSIAQLGALQSLDLSNCNKLKEFPDFTRMPNLETLDLSDCNLTDGGLPEDIGSLSSLKKMYLRGNNFEHLPRSIAQLGALRSLDLSGCNKLKELPEFPQQLHTIKADWSNDSICNSLFRNISSLQHDISVSDSLSLRVFSSWLKNIPSWFHHQGTGTSVPVNLHNNWYISDKFLGFAVCYSGKLIDITAHLCDDEMNQKFALSNHSILSNSENAMHFFLVPLAGLWDASKENGKTPNDYEIISLFFGEVKEFGVRLLYKDEPDLHIPIRRSRYEETCCCFPLLQLFPRRPGL